METSIGLYHKQKKKIFEICSLIRLTELEIANKYNENKMRCPVHLSIGQESVPAVLSLILKKKDFAVSTHRSHAHYLGKGGNLNKMIAEIYGKSSGCSGGKGGSMHLVDKKVGFMGSSSIVGNSVPIGVGLAMSLKLKKKKNISIIFLGDAAVETGVFFESINFAIIKDLPAVFICENNLYSVYTHIKERQPKNRKIFKMISGLGMKSFKFDSSKPLIFVNKLKKILANVRKNSKPCFIEFSTYRHLEHCGPLNDDKLNYRSKSELKRWISKDPYINLKKNLLKEKFFRFVQRVEKKNKKKIKEAFKFAEKSNFPLKNEMYKNVYK